MTKQNLTLIDMIRRVAGIGRLGRVGVVAVLVVAGVLTLDMVSRANTTPVAPVVAAGQVFADVAEHQEKELMMTLAVPEEELMKEIAPEAGKRVIWMEVTAYCPCTKCCGPKAQGITASGKKVSYNGGRFVAADTSVLPMHTKLSIPGYHGGMEVKVLDRGGAIKGNKLDVYFPSHRVAKEWGRRFIPVTVIEDETVDAKPVQLANAR